MLPKGFLELARTLIGANTVSSQGTRRAADLLQSLWEHTGLPVRRQVVEEVHVNLLAGPGGLEPEVDTSRAAVSGGGLPVTHLDTAPPAPGWATAPFELRGKERSFH